MTDHFLGLLECPKAASSSAYMHSWFVCVCTGRPEHHKAQGDILNADFARIVFQVKNIFQDILQQSRTFTLLPRKDTSLSNAFLTTAEWSMSKIP